MLHAAEDAYLCGADALIVADLGAAAQIRKRIPIALHASTQVSGHNVAAARLLLSGDPIRAYVYEKSAVLLKMRGMISAISALPCLLAVALYLLLHGFEGKLFATLAYFLLLSLSALLSFFLFRLSGTLRYEKQLPPSLDEKD